MGENRNLEPSLGLWTSISLVVGGIIGSGIFMKPALMASQLGSPQLLIFIWIIAGVLTLFGALSNAEVAAMIPETGGQYIFFQKMYGDFIAFLYGWAGFAVFNTAGVASIAYILGTYTEYFYKLPRLSVATEHEFSLYIPYLGHIYPIENIGVKGVTIFIIVVLTWINLRSTRTGGNIQVIFTILKIAAMVLIVFGILGSGKGNMSNLIHPSSVIHPEGWGLLGAITAALSGAFWGYDGWNNITFVAGEIRDPQINIPKSLLSGILICIVTYVLITVAYLYILPIDTMASSSMVATDAATSIMGPIGGGLIAFMVIVSTFGTTNANVLATARVSFAMAREKRFFEFVGKVHPLFSTPANALILHAVWTTLLVLSGSFDMLTDMLVFVSWLFYGMSAAGVFILRRKMPTTARPYRVWGYPWIPGIFVIFTLTFLIATLTHDIIAYAAGETPLINSVFGLVLTAFGIPLYAFFRIKQPKI